MSDDNIRTSELLLLKKYWFLTFPSTCVTEVAKDCDRLTSDIDRASFSATGRSEEGLISSSPILKRFVISMK